MSLQPHRVPRRHLISVAPMMDYTDRHFRYFLRQLTRCSLLYTEMVHTGAVLHGREDLLAFSPEEHPISLQLGGEDPDALARAAERAFAAGYDEVNLNVGCPSERVQTGRFGACLMRTPEVVARAVEAMRSAVPLPVTVKHRIGVDELDRYEDLLAFVDAVAAAGADRLIIHARKAWLSGLSPRENRTVPPLRYGEVHRLKGERPELAIEINGGIVDLDQAAAHLAVVDGVMIGRAACDDPYLFAEVDPRFYGDAGPPPSRREVIAAMLPYLERWLPAGTPLARITRHWAGLFAGERGARAWKRILAEQGHRPGAGPEVVEAALAQLSAEVLDARGGLAPPSTHVNSKSDFESA
ncbi:MAG: tRNA dihydrouridine(20/20a) synthase DusA [Thermoanaerobaculia bacterium]